MKRARNIFEADETLRNVPKSYALDERLVYYRTAHGTFLGTRWRTRSPVNSTSRFELTQRRVNHHLRIQIFRKYVDYHAGMQEDHYMGDCEKASGTPPD